VIINVVNVSPSAKARVEVKVYVCEREVVCVKSSMRNREIGKMTRHL